MSYTAMLRDTYDCRSCGARRGQPCTTKDGRPTPPHQDRWDQDRWDQPHQAANIPDGRKDQETIMTNDDERDYDDEKFNRKLMHDTSEDPEGEDDGTRVIAFRVPVRVGRNVTDVAALTAIRQIMARSWDRLAPMSELAGPVTVIPEEAPGEATTCDRCGIHLVAGEGDSRYCGTCANTLEDGTFEIFVTQTGRGFQMSGAALRQAVESGADEIRFTAPDGYRFGDDRRLHPEPDAVWLQRAVDAEAALTEIGGIMASPRPDLVAIDRILREAGQQADRLMPPGLLTPHRGMHTHDGYVPHSHEVRPDHKGVRRDPA